MATKNDEAIQYNGEDLKSFYFPTKFDHRQSAVPENPCYNFQIQNFYFFYFIVVTQLGEIFVTPCDNIYGIWDLGYLLTTPLNQLYQNYRCFSALMQISSGFILDLHFFIFLDIGFCMKEILDCLQFLFYSTLSEHFTQIYSNQNIHPTITGKILWQQVLLQNLENIQISFIQDMTAFQQFVHLK
ncbi:unnamed protein product [Paramecium sonneborni]|uniref:Uncharacterized protein n=1 Tax=Paramecium sonneborni TaxID=65129 RepID=A0A8S1MLD8_9CILI|nr:unnamed protein product [Paramecium sonneborni]